MAEKCLEIDNGMAKFSIQITKNTQKIISKVHKVSKIPLSTIIVSPDFHLSANCMATIFFEKNLTQLFVFICNKSDAEIKIERTIVLFDCNYRKLHEKRDAKIFTLEKDKRVDVNGNVSNRRGFETLPNDTLIIDLCITIKEIQRKETGNFICDIDPERKLREDLLTMLENPVNSDVSLQVGDERIPAHWSILCSRSPYFKKMFESNMKERVENSITITDVSLSALKKFIEFLYTANFVLKDDLQELFDLYYAADKYEVMDLRILCGYKIMKNASIVNVCKIIQFAHRHNDKDLKKQAMHFIQLHSEAVLQTDGWKKFEASEPLAAEVFSFCFEKK